MHETGSNKRGLPSTVKVIACIEDQEAIDRILAHLRRQEQEAPARPLLVPPTRAPPGTLPLFAEK